MDAERLFFISMGATWLILFYHVFLTVGGYKHFLKTMHDDDVDMKMDYYPFVSVLVPAHNEEAVIGRTVEALGRFAYPKDRYEIVVINDCSSDKTGLILEEKQKKIPQLKVVTLQPPVGAKGKSNALNHGLKVSCGEYVAVYDADNTPERGALLQLVYKLYTNDKLGAVVGKFRTRNRNVNYLTCFINIETLSFQWLLQASRCYWFGLTTIPGTNFVVRRSILESINGWNDQALTEDTELTIRIYDFGYTIFWYPHAVTWEQEPESLRVWMKQRTRWARGNLWIISQYLLRIFQLKDRKIGTDIVYFAFTYFVFFAAVIISDILFVLGALGIVRLSIDAPLSLIWMLAYALFVTETFISLSLERGEGSLSNLFLICLMYFTYCQLWIILVFKALYESLKDKIQGKGFHWYKTERSSN